MALRAPSISPSATLADMSRLEKLERLLQADPRDTFTLYALAQEHAKAGAHARAIEFFDRTLEVDPAYCYAYFHKARAQHATGDLPGARATALAGVQAALRAGDGKAHSELSNLQIELAEAS